MLTGLKISLLIQTFIITDFVIAVKKLLGFAKNLAGDSTKLYHI